MKPGLSNEASLFHPYKNTEFESLPNQIQEEERSDAVAEVIHTTSKQSLSQIKK